MAFEVPKYHKLLHAPIPAEVFQVHCSNVVPSIHTRWHLVFEIRPLNMQGEEIGGPYSLVGTDRWPIGRTLLLLACFTMTVVEVAHQNRVVTTEQERWGWKLEASRSRVVRVQSAARPVMQASREIASVTPQHGAGSRCCHSTAEPTPALPSLVNDAECRLRK